MTRTPEANVFFFGFLLNYPWEFIQTPLYQGMSEAAHWEAVQTCTVAALGDAALILIAYWAVAALRRNRRWIVGATQRDIAIMVSIGVVVTIVVEWLALRGWWLTQWRYSALMVTIPWLGVGWVPILQWLVLPIATARIVSRQLVSIGLEIHIRIIGRSLANGKRPP